MKLCHFTRFLLVLKVLVVDVGSLTFPDLFDDSKSECKKDVLILWDNSNSVSSQFPRVKQFIKDLVGHRGLNVKPNGNHVALITFSDSAEIQVSFEDERSKNREDLLSFIDDLDYKDLIGHFTRTGYALEVAKKKIFSERSPENARKDVDDVLIIVTDGEPTCNPNRIRCAEKIVHVASRAIPVPKPETELAKESATALKDQGILIVGALITREEATAGKKKILMKKLEELVTSKEYAFQADFKDLDNIVKKLISPICKEPACKCPASQESDTETYVKPGVFEVWVAPHASRPKCDEGTVSMKPRTCAERVYPLGHSVVNQTYIITNGEETYDLTCHSNVYVKVIKCGSVSYNPRKKVCCYGTLHNIKQGWQCCGCTYYDTKEKKCCYPEFAATFVRPNDNCPVLNSKL